MLSKLKCYYCVVVYRYFYEFDVYDSLGYGVEHLGAVATRAGVHLPNSFLADCSASSFLVSLDSCWVNNAQLRCHVYVRKICHTRLGHAT